MFILSETIGAKLQLGYNTREWKITILLNASRADRMKNITYVKYEVCQLVESAELAPGTRYCPGVEGIRSRFEVSRTDATIYEVPRVPTIFPGSNAFFSVRIPDPPVYLLFLSFSLFHASSLSHSHIQARVPGRAADTVRANLSATEKSL